MIAGLDRINELAKIEKKTGLTEKERAEQKVLREDYLRQIRGQVIDSISVMTVIDPLGNDVTPEIVKEMQAKGKEAQ